MHIDARDLPNRSLIEGDICIIGAGAAGISIALQWINAPYKVILLEGGGFEVDEKIQDFFKGKNFDFFEDWRQLMNMVFRTGIDQLKNIDKHLVEPHGVQESIFVAAS